MPETTNLALREIRDEVNKYLDFRYIEGEQLKIKVFPVSEYNKVVGVNVVLYTILPDGKDKFRCFLGERLSSAEAYFILNSYLKLLKQV